jgi:4-hydroxybenzoyl-CoA thioesterase
VAIDDARRAVPCPTWEPANDEDRALDSHAVELVGIRDRFGD